MTLHEDTAPFGGRVTDVVNSSFKCVVTTAKEGVLKGLSTMVVEVDDECGGRPCAKIFYSSAARKQDRQQFHSLVAAGIDEAGEQGCSLREAVDLVIKDLKGRGVVSEFMNFA